MEATIHPEISYLQEANLEFLHGESQKWLNEIAFWKDEMAFFYKLIHKKEVTGGFPSEQLADLDRQIIRINTDKLDQLLKDIQQHERTLATLVKSALSPEEKETYLFTHQHYLVEMEATRVEITGLKKAVYSFFEKYL